MAMTSFVRQQLPEADIGLGKAALSGFDLNVNIYPTQAICMLSRGDVLYEVKAQYSSLNPPTDKPAQTPLFEIFHGRMRDPVKYGIMRDDGFHGTLDQKLQCIKHVLSDVVSATLFITEKLGDGVQDYALWYRLIGQSLPSKYDAYDRWITLCACHSVVHSRGTCVINAHALLEYKCL